MLFFCYELFNDFILLIMFIVVQKFGGTSVANIERIKKVSQIIAKEKSKDSQVIAVVSAISGVTDQLIHYTQAISSLSSQDNLAEYDTVISSGEQVTAGLLSLALQSIGIKARSFLGWQLPIVTDSAHANGRIVSVGTTQLIDALKKNEVPVISGFQGVYNERIVTLGRGGSDTSAVAIAAAVCANRCDIFTDVEGVFSADPRIVSKARKIENIGYKQMLTMATAGAKIIHPRAVDISLNHNLETCILSSFSDAPGTILVKDNKGLERASILAVVSDSNIAIIKIFHILNNDTIKKLIDIFEEQAISMELLSDIVHSNKEQVEFKFSITKSNLLIVIGVLSDLKLNFTVQEKIAKITIISNGLAENSMILQKIFQIFANQDITILSINAIGTNVSIIVAEQHKNIVTVMLHSYFGLDKV